MLKKPLPLAALFILTNALYFWMASRTLPALMAFAGGLPPLDALPFGYAPDYPARLFAALGEAGRDYYRAPQLILDSFYPLLFALTYANLLAVLIFATLKTLTGFLTLAGILLLSLRWLWRYYKARRG